MRRPVQFDPRDLAAAAGCKYEGPPRDVPARVLKRAAIEKLAPVDWVAGAVRSKPVPVGPFCAATYVSIEATCPGSCPFYGRDGGCYASTGFTKYLIKRLDAGARRIPNVIGLEVAAILRAFRRGVPPGLPLRLHVSGDVRHAADARALADVEQWYTGMGGGPMWTFTHRWREVPSRAWGVIQVRAAVETTADARAAMRRGYTVAQVFEELPSERKFVIDGLTYKPCSFETRGVPCVRCRFCLSDAARKKDIVLALGVHGKGAGKAKARLRRLNSSSPGSITDRDSRAGRQAGRRRRGGRRG
jgi:hypothetical protein